jgi:integrase
MTGAELEPVGDAHALPTLGDARRGLTREDADPAVTLPALLATSTRRARWLSERLAEQVAQRGLAAMVDDRYAVNATGELVRVGEDVRALAVLEAAERDRAAQLGEKLARLGLDAAARPTALPITVAVEWIQRVCEAAGLDWSQDSTRRLAQRALIDVEQRRHAQSS